jgi:tetratricopeptide (TPR) repeat protein
MGLERLLNRRYRYGRISSYRRRRSRWPVFAGIAGSLVLGGIVVLYFVSGRSSDDTLRRASEARDSRDYDRAAAGFEKHLQEHPSDSRSPEVRFQLANIYFLNLKQYDRARNLYRDFLNDAASSPNAPLARERLADVLAETGRSYEAIAEYENLNPPDEKERRRIRLRIADLYFDQRNYSQALTEYDKVTEQSDYDELSEQALLREASIYHLARSQYQQALPVYERLAAATSDPEVRDRALLGMSDCHAGLFQLDQAIKLLHEIKSTNQQAYVSRRISELEQQKREGSRVPEVRFTRKTTVEETDKKNAQKKEGEKKEPKRDSSSSSQ